MFDTTVLRTGLNPQRKATAGFATGAIMLAIFVSLIAAQLMFAIRNPATIAVAEQQAPIGIVAP